MRARLPPDSPGAAIIRLAYERPCPRCGAPAGDACRRPSGVTYRSDYQHLARWKSAQADYFASDAGKARRRRWERSQ